MAGATATLAGGIDHPPPGAAAFDFQYIAPPANAAATARATTAPALLLAFMFRSLFFKQEFAWIIYESRDFVKAAKAMKGIAPAYGPKKSHADSVAWE
ncbi:hypothetical protein [Achromobacter mucicolens]|uniref:hypothetical protein n=1 Tax=Achromobacter mucicolens TaxID=1389922 RepID=UPI0028A5A5F4|nr:hypothetical protein [Achromobacter mucicolens]